MPEVYKLYMERHISKKWDENDNWDNDRFFLEVEKEIWTHMYAHRTDELNVNDELEEASIEDEAGDSNSSEEYEVIELKLKESTDSSSDDDGSSSDDSSSSAAVEMRSSS